MRAANARIRSSLHDVRQQRLPDRRSKRRKLKSHGRTETPAGGARRDRTDDLLLAKQALSQLSYGPDAGEVRLRFRFGATAFAHALGLPSRSSIERRLVGLGRLELPTSRLSSARSNQLSYKPKTLGLFRPPVLWPSVSFSAERKQSGTGSSMKKEKRRRRRPANGRHRS